MSEVPSELAAARERFMLLVADLRPELHRYCSRLVGSDCHIGKWRGWACRCDAGAPIEAAQAPAFASLPAGMVLAFCGGMSGVTYRDRPCSHCGPRAATLCCASCDEPLCDRCELEGRCIGCLRRERQRVLRRRRRFLRLVLPALAPSAIALAALAVAAQVASRGLERGYLHHGEAQLQLRHIQQALALYALERGDCPMVLEALSTRGYLDESEPVADPWGRPVDYRCADVPGGRWVTLRSPGADGRLDTDDDVRVEQRISW
jgi:hypothetical protein